MGTCIYVTGDVHGELGIRKFNQQNLGKFLNNKNDNYIIVAGDFGLVFSTDPNNKVEKYWLDWLEKKPFKVLFVDGNHENFDRLYSNEFRQERNWKGGSVSFIRDNVIWLHRGQVFDIDGYKIFTMGGATSIDKACRKPGISWWPQENISDKDLKIAQINLQKHDYKVDAVITHAAPLYYAQAIFPEESYHALDINEMHLEDIRLNIKYRHWFCGHYHIEDYVLHPFDKNISFKCLYFTIFQIYER